MYHDSRTSREILAGRIAHVRHLSVTISVKIHQSEYVLEPGTWRKPDTDITGFTGFLSLISPGILLSLLASHAQTIFRRHLPFSIYFIPSERLELFGARCVLIFAL